MNPTQSTTSLLKTKQHFEILDGLRGVAAVAVVIFHFMEFIFPDYKDNFIAHGYFAVDFFFCLSGFVIAYAYDNRMAQIGAATFFRLRLIRLHPLVVIGAVLGLLSFIFDPFSNLYEQYGKGQTVLMFCSSSLLIPYPIVPERYLNLFHFNPPTWSLFWEYVANVGYAIILFKLRNRVLWILTAIAAVLLFFEAFRSSHLSIGWGGDNFIGGGARVFYSFLAGMLVYRSGWIIPSRLGFIGLSTLLLLAFLVPFYDKINWLTDPLIVVFYFPLLVALGAGAPISTSLRKVCKFSGDISYPLYMVHYPFLWILYSYIQEQKPSLTEMVWVTIIGSILLIALAYAVLVWIDEPLRNYLKGRMKQRFRHQNPDPANS